MEQMTCEEVQEALEDAVPGTEEYEALCWLRDVYYLAAEGFIELEGEYCFPGAIDA